MIDSPSGRKIHRISQARLISPLGTSVWLTLCCNKSNSDLVTSLLVMQFGCCVCFLMPIIKAEDDHYSSSCNVVMRLASP
jgi:hypothetical protein